MMLFFNALQLDAMHRFDLFDARRYLPIAYYSICPHVAKAVYIPLAKKLTLFERHVDQDQGHAYYILKVFSMQFVNHYSSVLYAAIWLQDMALVRSLLLSLLIVQAVFDTFVYVGVIFYNAVITYRSSTI